MERLQNFRNSIASFCQSVIEWRSPATAPYLMLINVVFWGSVIYYDEPMQIKMLISLAAGIFGWDVLLTPSHEHSIATHILLWPLQSFWRTFAVGGSLYSANSLRKQDLEIAFWTAYGALGCLLVNPVWQHYEVNQKIGHVASLTGQKTAEVGKTLIIQPLQAVYSAVKYVVTLQFIPPLWRAIKSFFSNIGGNLKAAFWAIINWWKSLFRAIGNWIDSWIVQPIKNFIYATGRWLRYWFCAHWWPDLKAWMKIHIGQPLKRMFNYFCYGLVYVFCGHWVPPLADWIGAKLKILGAYLHRTVIVPTKIYLKQKFDEFRVWLRSQLHRLALAIRDSVLWPICILMVDVGKEVYAVLHRIILKPIFDYLYGRYKIVETTALIYFLGPVCEKFVNNIPEKNPFCDDSDVELEGMLPDEVSTEAEIDDEDEEPGREGRQRPDGDSHNNIESEEDQFISGLAFPTIQGSESDEEEFRPEMRKVIRRKKKQPELAPEKRGAGPEKHYDEDFEVLS
ncbi:hypothetical protein WR25_16193 [Diploscapter pachys]|uniref:Uncharacterized protein n=1 Tax=Diploscapter pachys TaxID=2018661 RepID=A0A2A2L932_9BILA|nr:hypothetical protein WR25_16193 [Diploscapter pachys]